MATMIDERTNDSALPESGDEQELYEHHRVVCDGGQSLMRLDKFLDDRLPNISRTRIATAARAGSVRVNGKQPAIKAVADLPKERFNLTGAYLEHIKQVTDTGLANFKDCKNLTYLHLAHTKITDAGLANFKDCKMLASLDVSKSQVTPKAVAEFHAAVPGCQIKHDGGIIEAKDVDRKAAELVISLGGAVLVNGGGQPIRAVAELPKERFTLTDVFLENNAQVTAAGLAHFKDCKKLTNLGLSLTAVTDAGLAHFKDCKELTQLHAASTSVGDAGLTHFKDRTGLTLLNLNSTAVTDAGLAHLKDCKGLTILSLDDTKVSDAGLLPF